MSGEGQWERKGANGSKGGILAGSLCVFGLAQAAPDRFTGKALNGIGFAGLRGYEMRQDVTVGQTETCIKAILANPTMM